ncbi:MAG: hypothetical protein V1800_04265 [Candidatus Latescibacterota bacterium]
MRVSMILSLLLALFASCSPRSEGEERMTDEQFVAFFVAMSKVTDQYAADPAQMQEAHRRLHREYRLAPETVQAAVAHYQEHPERWVPILEQIGEQLKKAEEQICPQSPKIQPPRKQEFSK